MGAPSWATRERVILKAIAERETAIGGPDWHVLPGPTGLTEGEVQKALRRLDEADYISGINVTSMGSTGYQVLNVTLTERGLREVGEWPTETPTARF